MSSCECTVSGVSPPEARCGVRWPALATWRLYSELSWQNSLMSRPSTGKATRSLSLRLRPRSVTKKRSRTRARNGGGRQMDSAFVNGTSVYSPPARSVAALEYFVTLVGAQYDRTHSKRGTGGRGGRGWQETCWTTWRNARSLKRRTPARGTSTTTMAPPSNKSKSSSTKSSVTKSPAPGSSISDPASDCAATRARGDVRGFAKRLSVKNGAAACIASGTESKKGRRWSQTAACSSRPVVPPETRTRNGS
mmetsp:Transcript_15285/g.51398  ORF Transcript_15285/g.51398 Transcript_15285/m.51398 type:complete len:250 (+) Transcript_15285:308-1057(+)